MARTKDYQGGGTLKTEVDGKGKEREME